MVSLFKVGMTLLVTFHRWLQVFFTARALSTTHRCCTLNSSFLPPSTFRMCCSPYSSPKKVVKLFGRIGVGLGLAFVGFAHYQDPTFAEATGRGLGMLESLGMVWGYILPGLMILGGLLLAFGIFLEVSAYALGIALASIVAGTLLKSAIGGISLGDTMPMAVNAIIWLIALQFVMKKPCHASCGPNGNCGPNCNCGPDMPVEKPVMKNAPVMPVATKAPSMSKPAMKKPAVKKVAPKRK